MIVYTYILILTEIVTEVLSVSLLIIKTLKNVNTKRFKLPECTVDESNDTLYITNAMS